MAPLVYALCALTSLGCCVALSRAFRARRSALLFWASACFALLALENALLIVDRVLLPGFDLALVRHLVGLVAPAVLLFSLIAEAE